MPSCDTCALLKVPENTDHAQHYRICGWQPRALPEPVLQFESLRAPTHVVSALGYLEGPDRRTW